MSSSATKAQSQKIFEKLKTKPANKVDEHQVLELHCTYELRGYSTIRSTNLDVWQWDQLRIMKVGGNESATKYFQSHGGTAALASKDPKTKYTSTAATKYKDELKKRAAADAREYPEEVIVTDIVAATPTDGMSTPAEPGDDFFSSWDKPSIKRPSNPPSRTQTPPVVSRTASPFLNPGTSSNSAPRSKSPLRSSEGESSLAPSRAVPSAVIRKSTAIGVPRKTNVLGAKKTQKLGAKKLGGAEVVDFEAAEKKAKEEAERIEKLGYDPEAEAVVQKTVRSASISDKTKIAAPTPVNPVKGYGVPKHERTKSEMERLGMGMGRLGFGQVGGSKPAAAASKKVFGFVGASRAVEEDDDEEYARQKFGTQKGISSDEFFGRNNFDPSAQTEAKQRLQGFEGASSISSNAYFGRPEDDIPQADEYGNYGDLEGAARDFVRKFGVTAGDDLENLTNVLGEGATKLQGECIMLA
ncbi:MAG: ADP-ribosylation factor GTPase activating protein, ER-Golgi transport [Alectoria sarmentosa]|nr:MAG: ADP-ribosylation factor GTPase activating protein, ER-Golgi transport [Alectoria sarmentosa]